MRYSEEAEEEKMFAFTICFVLGLQLNVSSLFFNIQNITSNKFYAKASVSYRYTLIKILILCPVILFCPPSQNPMQHRTMDYIYYLRQSNRYFLLMRSRLLWGIVGGKTEAVTYTLLTEMCTFTLQMNKHYINTSALLGRPLRKYDHIN